MSLVLREKGRCRPGGQQQRHPDRRLSQLV